jgi:hypothetical protein
MRAIKADLLADVVSVYDQTKTTITGRVAQKNIGGTDVLGPPIAAAIDFATDTGGLVPTSAMHATPNGRLFICGTVSPGIIPICLYDFNYTTGAYAYVGRINMVTPNTAATTHTIRSIRAVDTGITGWRIFVTTTASVLINGGAFMLNDIAKADFVLVSFPNIPLATSSSQKATYFLQDPASLGTNHLNVASVGSVLDTGTNRLYVHNGVNGTAHQYYVYDTAAAATYTTTSVSVSVASPGIVTHAGHSFGVNAPVVFTAGTVPTGLTVGTVYFVRNPVAGTSYELSATSGGTSINTTGSPSAGAFLGRAFGTTGSNFLHKTGNLPTLIATPLPAGAFLGTDVERKAVPVSAPLNGGVLNGNACVAITTANSTFLGLLSELTPGATTWPSLTGANLIGTANEITTPAAVNAGWSDTADMAVFLTNTAVFQMKKVENNVLRYRFGQLSNRYYETTALSPANVDLAAISLFDNESGWMFIGGSTVGQRVIIAFNLRAHTDFDQGNVITKVLDTSNSQLKFIDIYKKLNIGSGDVVVHYRTSGFGSISGGWTAIDEHGDLSLISTATQIQFKISFNVLNQSSVSPAQVAELVLGLTTNSETSDNWEYSYDNTSSGSPTRVGFRLKKAYTSTVPTMYFRAYDLSDSLLTNHNTSADAARFEYSTDDGTSWLPLGTVPNTVGTLIRYNFTSPPGVKVRPGLKES